MNEPEIIEDEISFIDLTNTRTFTIAAFLAVLFGFMIGLGYLFVFAQYPHLNNDNKIAIFVITLIVGVTIGAIPAIYRQWLENRNEL